MTLRESCIDRVAIALTFEVPEASRNALEERAESLVAIAEKFGVPVQPVLLQWIHFRMEGKQWSGEEWTRYCVKYSEAKRELGLILGVDDEALTELSETMPWSPGRMVCTRCYANEALELMPGKWICPQCGDIS